MSSAVVAVNDGNGLGGIDFDAPAVEEQSDAVMNDAIFILIPGIYGVFTL